MGLHGCNELCDLHPDMHRAQRELLELEGGHDPEDKVKLLEALKERVKSDMEMIAILEQ